MARFETFTKSLIALGRDPHVTVQKRGTLTLNAAAYAALESPAAVELLFDRDDHVLGLRACPVDVDHAAFVRPASKTPSGPFVISAMAFLKHYEIDTSEARRFPAEIKNGVLCVRLRGPFDTVSKKMVVSEQPQQRRPRQAR